MRTIDEIMAEFVAEWRNIPPLVRAGIAEELQACCVRGVDMERAAAVARVEAGMDRRAAIRLQFSLANQALADMFRALTIAADAEAVARGIDADTLGEEVTLAV